MTNRLDIPPQDDLKVNDRCIIIHANGYSHLIGLACEVVDIHEPPVEYIDAKGRRATSPNRLYRVGGDHLPPTPPIAGVRHKTWLCPRHCLMKIPPDPVGDEKDTYREPLVDDGGIIVPEHLADNIFDWLERESKDADWTTHPKHTNCRCVLRNPNP